MSAHSDIVDGGYFVDSDDEFEVEEVSENPLRYLEGLYYPIGIGEILANQYQIEHKLGHGGFSTIYMAYDILGKKDVMLKIMTPKESNEHEHKMQTETARDVQDASHLILYEKTFLLRGSHRNHRVLVLPVQGPNLWDHLRQKPVTIRMSAAKQLLQAISHLHDSGIVHRDLSSAKVMYSLRPINNISVAEKYHHIGRPKKVRLDPDLWKAGELVMPMKVHESLIGDDVSLGDFGLAIKPGNQVSQKLQSPAIYCAPERVPTFATDMWSYMLSCMVHALGSVPATWKGTFKAGGVDNDWWYDQGYELDSTASLKAKVPRLRSDIDAVERDLVLSVLRKGLSYQPQDRLTARQLLEDASFKALMEIYGV
ncbi:uncharacterized protein FRV6_08400 [Fusarium oxysporum]|uniref:Protein kinase domain-containing protein n=1 Tax=Fusarium oxysporum TaxID=5507 RepID=A0A2H3T6E3_FUSOX|nr:uncharacterized protein FRV6_08400 [Fusarium oxysporum]